MKRVIFAGVCMVVALVFAEVKIGAVSLGVLIKNHPSHESKRTLVESTADEYRKNMESRQEAAKKLVDEGLKMSSAGFLRFSRKCVQKISDIRRSLQTSSSAFSR